MDPSTSGNQINSFERYLDLMHNSMDTNVDPTVDFIKYARGNFRRENYDVTKGDYLPVVSGDSYENIMLNETLTYPSLRKARDYRKSHVKEFKTLLRNKQLHEICGTFPAFDDNWKSENFDWIKAFAILSAMHFRIILSYGVDYEDVGKSIVLSIIGPDETPSSNPAEILKEMDISDEKIPDIISDVKLIGEKFDEITPVNGYPHFEKLQKSYRELKEEKFDYQKLLETLLREPVDDDDVIYLNNLEPGYFEKFLDIFEDVGPKAVANYITYKVAYQLENDYYSGAVTLYHFTPAVLVSGYTAFWQEDTIRRRQEVFHIFKDSLEKIKDNFKRDVTSELDFHKLCEQEIKDFIDANFSQEEIEKEYEDLEINPENFFQNFLNIRKQGMLPSTKRYLIMSRNIGNENLFRDALTLLNFLVQTHNKPMFFYFSGWELNMWNGIISQGAFDKKSEDYKELIKRVNEQIDKYNLPRGIVNDEFWINSNISHMVALKLAFQDYETWLSQNKAEAKKEEELLKNFNLTCAQAFFISYVQHHCWEDGVILNSVILSLLNSEEFSQAFHCQLDSAMNPNEKIVINFNKN